MDPMDQTAGRQKQSFTSRPNLEFLESLYDSFKKDPSQVDGEWRLFFEGVEFGQGLKPGASAELGAQVGLSSKDLEVFRYINAYRDYGHFEANLNPLSDNVKSFPELSPINFGLTESDFDKVFAVGEVVGLPGATLREILAHLRASYCGTITVNVSDANPGVRGWFRKEFESGRAKWAMTKEDKLRVFEQLAKTESFEKFIHTRFVGKKRFSIEGADSLIPMLETFVDTGSELGMEELVIGMAHRGRLNVLANFMGKAAEMIFTEFEGYRDENNSFFDGDVKYHLGYSVDKKTSNGKSVHASMAFNPSHLETVNPVVIGMVRAKQRRRRDTSERKKVVPILIHGDAAFAGQGVVAETFQMSQLQAYTVGGTVHVIVDNQIGFTTSPEYSRSSPYASDLAKMIQTPVLLVNGDDVEACCRAMSIAVRFRQEFKRDIVVHVICYRRFGHNEGDEPAFTQPLMYEKIKKHPTAYDIYAQKLVKDSVITDDEPEKIYKIRIEKLQVTLEQAQKSPPAMKPLAFEGVWKGLRRSLREDFSKSTNTKASKASLMKVGEILTTIPNGFNIHPKVAKLLESRKTMLTGDGAIDWGMGELLAYGTLLTEGTPVRFTGQDVIRGTFSHRHAAFYDVKTGEKYTPLRTIKPEEVEFCIYDSFLSEYAVMGFEYGNSSSDPTYLTIWEAQFGDFVNGAQIIIDQFISSAEQKWQRMSGLVLLLPHGYEGQGPEHSSARLERFLQLCAQDNMQVMNLTTPANLFHALRRQMKRDFRKPLIVMSPKSLLRHPKVLSKISDFTDGTFQEVIADELTWGAKNVSGVERLILCSGKVYYDLLAAREAMDAKEQSKFALVRVEQLYPFPGHLIGPILKAYKNMKEVVWCQEEPKNMGSWTFMKPLLDDLLEEQGLKVPVRYTGRDERASPATGSEKVHAKEQKELVSQALTLVGKSAAKNGAKNGAKK
ncbi:2-oxoglutarate dehydrogenase E1 component [soil metagenome]